MLVQRLLEQVNQATLERDKSDRELSTTSVMAKYGYDGVNNRFWDPRRLASTLVKSSVIIALR